MSVLALNADLPSFGLASPQTLGPLGLALLDRGVICGCKFWLARIGHQVSRRSLRLGFDAGPLRFLRK